MGNALSSSGISTKHYGALGGGQAGYNWQSGMWLAGFETDMDFAHQRITTGSGCAGAICNPAITAFDAPVSLIHQHNLDWFGTLRGRLGATITPDLLAYGTGGLAYSEIEHVGIIYGSDGIASGDAPNIFNNRALRPGWAAGGGIEARLGGNVTGKIEYLHMDFGLDKAQAILPQNATPLVVNFNSRITEDLVRLGINYKFDPYFGLLRGRSGDLRGQCARAAHGLQGAGRGAVDLDRVLFRSQCRLRCGQICRRHARERRYAWNTAARGELLLHAQGRHRRWPSRLQLAGRHVARRPRD